MNKYQRALEDMKQGKTWEDVAQELSDAIGEKVHRSDPWCLYNGKTKSSRKVMAGLEELGLVESPGKRYRLAAEFESEERVKEFKEFYGIDNRERTFTDVVHRMWIQDKRRKNESQGFKTNGDGNLRD